MTDSASQSLVERLNAAWRDEKSVSTYARLCRNAAARIAELEAGRDRLQHALQFWMPGVDARLDDATQERAANDAYLLVDYRGQLDGPCWGDAVLDDLARVRDELDASNNNHRAMAHQMAELGARCKHAESELSRVEEDTRERCAAVALDNRQHSNQLSYRDDSNGYAEMAYEQACDDIVECIRSHPPLAKRGDQKSCERSNPPAEQSPTLPQPLTES